MDYSSCVYGKIRLSTTQIRTDFLYSPAGAIVPVKMVNGAVIGFFAGRGKETTGNLTIFPVIGYAFTALAPAGTGVGASTVCFGITGHALTSSRCQPGAYCHDRNKGFLFCSQNPLAVAKTQKQKTDFSTKLLAPFTKQMVN